VRETKIHLRCLVILLASGLSACVFPTRLADEVPFREDVIGSVEIGKTTREEIRVKIGEPAKKFADGRWWVYNATREMSEWFWFFCAQTGCGGGDLGGGKRLYSLIIEYDEESALKKTTVVHEKKPCSRDGSICYREGLLDIAWDSEESLVNFPGACSLTIYGQTPALRFDVWIRLTGNDGPTMIEYKRSAPSNRSHSVHTHVAGVGSPSGRLSDEYFVQLPMEAGQFEVRAIAPTMDMAAEPIELNCTGAETHFVKLLCEGPDISSLVSVGAELGRNDIRGRSLRLLPDR